MRRIRSKNLTNGPIWLLGVCAVLVAAVVAAIWAWHYVTTPYTGDDAVWIYIPAGATETDVAQMFDNELGASLGPRVYRLWQWQDGVAAKSHGAYRIEPGAEAWRIARTIAQGRQTPMSLTFNSLRTVDDLAAKVDATLEISTDQFLAAVAEELPGYGFESPEQFPAAFIPNKHEVYWTESAQSVVKRLVDDRNRFWNDDRRARAAEIGLTPVEVATLASIVEEETNKLDERPVVARLYLNRLACGMKLQADPTVKFALGDPTLQRICDVSVDSPYNTYKYRGLPPGPIRIVEPATMDAVLNAPEHNYLFMCAKEDFSGYHNFAVDGATHQANARRYQAELDRRGIK